MNFAHTCSMVFNYFLSNVCECVCSSYIGRNSSQPLPLINPYFTQTSLCQKWLQYHDLLRAEVSRSVLSRLHIKKLLRACCQSLIFDPNQYLATPLRMIEVYTSHTSYPSSNILAPMFSYVCSNGWFILYC